MNIGFSYYKIKALRLDSRGLKSYNIIKVILYANNIY